MSPLLTLAMALGAGAFGWLAVNAERRHASRWRPYRIAAAIVAAIALFLLGVRPERRVQVPRGTALLATAGATAAAVRHVADSVGVGRTFSLGVAGLAGAEPVADLAHLRRWVPGLQVLHVVGWGLTDAEWAGAEDLELVHHPAPAPPGIVALDYRAQIALGERLELHGAVRHRGPAGWLVLAGPDGPVDSMRLDRDGDTPFALGAVPRDTGAWLYTLHLPNARAADTFGVDVTAAAPLDMLVLESSPSFETRHLREWLAPLAARLAIRTAVSRGRYRTTFVNRATRPLAPLTADVLEGVDLVLADALALDALTARERDALLASVEEGGVGLLVRPEGRRRDILDRWFTTAAVGLDERGVRPRWPELRRRPRTPVPAAGLELRERFAVETVMRDEMGRPLAQIAPVGRGRVGVTLVAAPSRWLLAGDRESFAAYWSRLFDAVAGGRPSRARWIVPSGPLRPDRPASLTLAGLTGADIALVERPATNPDTLFLATDTDSTRRHATFRAHRAGWHRVAAGDRRAALYVGAAESWRARDAAERLAATRRRVATARPASAQPVREERRPLPLLLPFLTLVATLGVLWGTRRKV